MVKDYPGGPVAKKLPSIVGDTGSIPGLGRSHVRRRNSVHATTTEHKHSNEDLTKPKDKSIKIRVVRVGFTEKVTWEQRLIRDERVNQGHTQGKGFWQKEQLEQWSSKSGLHSDQLH